MKIKIDIPLVFLLILISTGCPATKEVSFSGNTMGTTYNIKIITSYFDGMDGLKQEIDNRLDEINRSMSVYIKDSEISLLNQSPPSKPMAVSRDFLMVIKTAEKLYRQTEGSWDGTVGPLVNLWGFGTAGNSREVPPRQEIEKLLLNTGFDNIQIIENKYLSKKKTGISLDLGSIAKGYGVDQIAKLIQDKGIKNYLVEIGGEVYAEGYRKDGGKWRIGINKPEKGTPFYQIYKIVSLYNKAMATSGDYRNFFEKNGKIYSHIIDPKTGYPVSNRVVSVSIIADSCTYADGLATAVMVMGPQKGIDLINRLENIEGLIIVMENDGRLTDHVSKGFDLYL
jgi:thiamine biosynthesis lipoprotein